MKKKQEERNRENDEFIKEILKDEKVPEYDPIAAFSRFEKKYLACKEESEEANKANKKKAKKEKPKDFFRDNKFKWKYWGPALATAIITIPLTAVVTMKIEDHHQRYDELSAVYNELSGVFKFVTLVDIIFSEQGVIDGLRPFVLYCENNKDDFYFVAYASVKRNEEVVIKIDDTTGYINSESGSTYYALKLDEKLDFEYQVSVNGGGFETYVFQTARYLKLI